MPGPSLSWLNAISLARVTNGFDLKGTMLIDFNADGRHWTVINHFIMAFRSLREMLLVFMELNIFAFLVAGVGIAVRNAFCMWLFPY